jgi:hypothetical protein
MPRRVFRSRIDVLRGLKERVERHRRRFGYGGLADPPVSARLSEVLEVVETAEGLLAENIAMREALIVLRDELVHMEAIAKGLPDCGAAGDVQDRLARAADRVVVAIAPE